MQKVQKTQVWFLGQEDPWRRKRQPTPVFLPGEFHGQRGLANSNPWGCKRVRHDWACVHTYTHTHTHTGLTLITNWMPTALSLECKMEHKSIVTMVWLQEADTCRTQFLIGNERTLSISFLHLSWSKIGPSDMTHLVEHEGFPFFLSLLQRHG